MTSTHSPESLFDAWTAVEVLTPQSSPEGTEDGKLIHSFEEGAPWLNPRRARTEKEKTIYWMLYLGALDLAKANEVILKAYPDDREDEVHVPRGSSPLVVLLLDEQGRIVPAKGTLSSFAWGIGQLLQGKLDQLVTFPKVAGALLDKLNARLVPKDGEPLSVELIESSVGWLIEELKLDKNMVEIQWQTVRHAFRKPDAEPPEPDILNSFFLNELANVKEAWINDEIGLALKAYITGQTSRDYLDIVEHPEALKEALQPGRSPAARWPGAGRHSLVLMQQASINHAVAELKRGGLAAINGPPGTGKTTLLRDMIADIVTQRATKLIGFSEPEQAFKYKPVKNNDGNNEHRYLLDQALLGYEIVVASSNNKAVENISREIPSVKALADDFDPPLRYFSHIADQLMSVGQPKEKQAEFKGSCWGLAAAVTGNAKNRAAFFDIVWWKNLKPYLWAIDNPSADKSAFQEQPPLSHEAALVVWNAVRKDFREKLQKVEDLKKKFEQLLGASDEVIKLDAELRSLKSEQASIGRNLEALQEKIKTSKEESQRAANLLKALNEDRATILKLKPGLFAHITRSAEFQNWQRQLGAVQGKIDKQRQLEQELQKVGSVLSVRGGEYVKRQTAITVQLTALAKSIDEGKKTIEEGATLAGANIADNKFWQRRDDELQVLSPWSCPAFNKARDDLFSAAFQVQCAFIDCAAKPLRHNLNALVTGLNSGLAGISKDMCQSLWASLFLVVPVLSTTFASFGRQFSSLGREQIGWLMIDEAGQAAPQAAVGALWRSKRALIIGDPLQIEPVTSLSNRLTAAIFKHHKVSCEIWAAPWVSAQVLADRTSWFGTFLEQDGKKIWVGSPLRVHRRCDEPMFSIANAIAYSGLMVHATSPQKSDIGMICGESRWVDVIANASGKWSQAEGDVIVDMLIKILNRNTTPDIFIITPFRQVASTMRRLVRDRLQPEYYDWFKERIGTVHTFQGKEAEAVILLLGAPGPDTIGARRWAGNRVNLLNVAVTRAKRRLYVVGNRVAWSGVPFFSDLAEQLPHFRG